MNEGKIRQGLKLRGEIKRKNERAKLRKRKIEEDEGREQIRKGQAISTLLLSMALNAKLMLLYK
jgi:hypothetical protein